MKNIEVNANHLSKIATSGVKVYGIVSMYIASKINTQLAAWD